MREQSVVLQLWTFFKGHALILIIMQVIGKDINISKYISKDHQSSEIPRNLVPVNHQT